MFTVGFQSVSFILTLVSFVFLLLATISVPVVKQFYLASTNDYNYGVFGYCPTDGKSCSDAGFPYDISFHDSPNDWLLGDSTRTTLAKTLIICPIACGLNLICLILIFVSHFFSSGIFIVTIVFNIITFIVTALIAVLVVIMFHPHVSWTGWILIGSAAASLISVVFLFLALRLSDPKGDDEENESINELNTFDDKFGNTNSGFMPLPPNNGGFRSNFNDNGSSISRDYEFKASSNQGKSNTMTSSSIYNSNPQLTKDFTQQNNNSFGSRSAGTHYEDAQVNLVNGPNTPISSKQQIAPSFVPNVATPTDNDMPKSNVPRVPYPSNAPLNKPPYGGADMSVFEHHPVVEGHRPFTELGDDDLPPQNEPGMVAYGNRGSQGSGELHSDASSDFTSVSQRAVNPRYNQGNNFGHEPYYGSQPQQYQSPYPQQQPFTPQFQQQMPPPMMQQQQPPPPQMQPQMGPQMGPPMQSMPPPQQQGFQQHRFAVPRPQPTASDNALANNPDFALGGGRRKGPMKPGMNMGMNAPSRMGGMPGMPGMGPRGPGQNGPGGPGRNGSGGPYGMM